MQGTQENGARGQGAAASSHEAGGASTQSDLFNTQTSASASAQNTVADLERKAIIGTCLSTIVSLNSGGANVDGGINSTGGP